MKDTRSPGYRWITPYLVVVNAQKSIAFYQAAFGFTTGYVGEDQGEIVHVSMQYRDKNIVMFNPEAKLGATQAPAPVTSGVDLPISLYLYVDDVDATVQKVVAAGGTVLMPPEDALWGDRFAAVKDIDGYTWSLGANLSNK